MIARALVLAALSAGTVVAQPGIDWSRRPVLLLTMGQGDEVFEKFGHNAIAVWDDAAGQPLVYNWGMFDFQQPNFLGRFLTGDTKYWMQPFTMAQTLDLYRRLDRTVIAEELQLTPAQKAQLVSKLAANAREENKYYRYDYYQDNCSTRARDAIDAVTDGVLQRAMSAREGQGSYRWHTRRLLAYSAPLYFGAEMVLGVDADAPLTQWQEAFLPQSLSESMRQLRLPAADSMPDRPLLLPADTLIRAQRDAEPRSVSFRFVLAASIGVALAVLLLALGKLGRVGAALAIGTWSLVSVLLGAVLLLAWFATRHVFMANNPTVALLNPLWLVGVVAAVMVLRGGVSAAVRRWLGVMLVIALLATVTAVLFGRGGSAIEMALLVLPAHLVVVSLARSHRRRADVAAHAS